MKFGRKGEGNTQHSCHSANLLVCQHRAALKGRQVAAEQGSAGSVMLAEDCTIDVMEAIARHQSVSTGGAAETLEVVNISLCPHHHFVGWDRLAAGAARPAVPEQSDVVTPTQNHSPFAVAGGANVPQLGLAARALEAASVPVAFHGEEQEAVGNLPPASCTRPGGRRYAWRLAVHHCCPQRLLVEPNAFPPAPNFEKLRTIFTWTSTRF